LDRLRVMIGSDEFKDKYRQSGKDFTRKRVLTFVGLVVSQINLMSKSLSVEVSKFVERFFGFACDYTKQAFSQRRGKLKAEAFTALNRELVGQFYVSGEYKTWQGYVVLATDGSTLQLPESKEITEEFGTADSKGEGMPLGRCSLLYDVENEVVLDALLEEYRASERHMALKHLNYLAELSLPAPCLLLYDRGYPSLWLLACLRQRQLDFVMRCKAHFLPEVAAFAQADEQDAVLELDLEAGRRLPNEQLAQFLSPGQTKLYVRAVKVELKSGQTEYLLTSLGQASLSTLKQLYHKRWGVETGLDLHKNALQLENFSAKTVLGVRQDFHSHMLAVNLSALLIADAGQELEQQQALKGNKHVYKVNRAVALGLVKDNLPGLLMGQEDVEQLYERLKGKIKRRREAVRPGRSFPRVSKRRYKFHINKRPVI
jgi:hypothetical protein